MLFSLRGRAGMYTLLAEQTIVSQQNFYSWLVQQSTSPVLQLQLAIASLLVAETVESQRAKRGCWRGRRGKRYR